MLETVLIFDSQMKYLSQRTKFPTFWYTNEINEHACTQRTMLCTLYVTNQNDFDRDKVVFWILRLKDKLFKTSGVKFFESVKKHFSQPQHMQKLVFF